MNQHMKNFLITEEETNRIKKLYGLITEEEGGELLDEWGYKIMKDLNSTFTKLEDNGDGTVTIVSDENITGKEHDAEIKKYIENTIGLDTWSKMPTALKLQLYSFMYDSDHSEPYTFRWITSLATSLRDDGGNYNSLYGKKKKVLDVTTPEIQSAMDIIIRAVNENQGEKIYSIVGGMDSESVIAMQNLYEKVKPKLEYQAIYRQKPRAVQQSYSDGGETKTTIEDWDTLNANYFEKETGKKITNRLVQKKQEPVQPPKKKIGGTPVYQPKTDETFDLFDEKVKQYADDIYGLFTSYVTEGDVTTINSLSTQTPYDEIKNLILKDIGKELYNSLTFSDKMSLYFYCVYFSIKDLSNIIAFTDIDSGTPEYADAMKEIKAGNDEIGFASRLIGSINFKVQSDFGTNNNDFTRYINTELIYQTASANLKENNTSKDVVSYIYTQIIEGKKYKTGKTKFSDENKIKTFLGIAIPPVVDATKKTAQAKNLFRSDKITDFDKKRVKKLQSKIRALDIEKRRIESIDKNDERLPELQDKITKYDNRITRIKSKYSQFEKELEAKKAKSTEDLTKTQVDSKKEKVKGQTSYELKPW